MEIQGYPNYLIYPDGSVYSNKKRKRFLKPQKNTKTGYLHFNLSHKNKVKNHTIHRLVAEHYIPNPLNLSCVDHIDRDKTNNNISNLRWVSHSDNNQNVAVKRNNKCGIKNIRYDKRDNIWKYRRKIGDFTLLKASKNKNIVLWVKFYDYILTN